MSDNLEEMQAEAAKLEMEAHLESSSVKAYTKNVEVPALAAIGDVPKTGKEKPAKVWHALISFGALVAIMAVGIIVFEVDPHVPMACGVVVAAVVSMVLGYSWDQLQKAMMDGVYRALQSIIILIIIGILIGVWIVAGVVPTMIYYGMMLLSPSIFLVAAVLICSITSLATGTSWGTIGTMGLALMGIAVGLGIPAPAAAGAIISGAYFGDKLSPLSDTTNLASAMAGTDVFTHIKFMILPTLVAYILALLAFAFLGFTYVSNGTVDLSGVQAISDGLAASFNINPVLLLPPLVVIVAVALKVPAIPGIALGIIAGAVCGMIFQPGICDLGAVLGCGMNGYVSEIGVEAVDDLLTSGGIVNMMSSVCLTILAMCFGGIMETTGQLEAVVNKLMGLVRGKVGLVVLTEFTCVLSNVTMPEQYISLVIPGRMYAKAYSDYNLDPKTLSNALESSGTVSSPLVPWNTCAVFIASTIGLSTFTYLPFCFFNLLMPFVTIILAIFGVTLADKATGKRLCTLKKEQPAA